MKIKSDYEIVINDFDLNFIYFLVEVEWKRFLIFNELLNMIKIEKKNFFVEILILFMCIVLLFIYCVVCLYIYLVKIELFLILIIFN